MPWALHEPASAPVGDQEGNFTGFHWRFFERYLASIRPLRGPDGSFPEAVLPPVHTWNGYFMSLSQCAAIPNTSTNQACGLDSVLLHPSCSICLCAPCMLPATHTLSGDLQERQRSMHRGNPAAGGSRHPDER